MGVGGQLSVVSCQLSVVRKIDHKSSGLETPPTQEGESHKESGIGVPSYPESRNAPNISSRQHSLLREIGDLCCIFVQFGL